MASKKQAQPGPITTDELHKNVQNALEQYVSRLEEDRCEAETELTEAEERVAAAEDVMYQFERITT